MFAKFQPLTDSNLDLNVKTTMTDKKIDPIAASQLEAREFMEDLEAAGVSSDLTPSQIVQRAMTDSDFLEEVRKFYILVI